MAVDNSKKGLFITLIVFAMLSFVLAITTYLFWQQQADAKQQAETAIQAKTDADREVARMTGEYRQLRQEILGTQKETIIQIQEERNQLFEQQFAAYKDGEKTFTKLAEWLNAKNLQLNQEKLELEQQKERLQQEKDAKQKADGELVKEVQGERDKSQQDLKQVQDAFAAQRAENERQIAELQQGKKTADERAEQMQAVTAGIGELGGLLSDDVRTLSVGSKPRSSKERRTRFERETSDTEKIKIVKEELQFAGATIERLNQTLARLDMADPELQRLVRESKPKDERIDGFDGRIIQVDSTGREALVSTPSTAGIRPGLRLSVFDPSDPRPREGDRKGVLEVIEVQDRGVARTRIKSVSVQRPILSGDGVATSLWSPGTTTEVVIVGHVSFQGSDDDAALLRRLIERAGARVVDDFTDRTRVVVDAGSPQARVKNWRKQDEDRRAAAVKQARALGVTVVGIDGLFDLMGLDPQTVRGGGIPGAAAGTAIAP